MAFTIDQYNTLIAAIAEGVTTVKYADKEITYRSLADMLLLKATMAKDLGLTSAGIKTTYARFSKGLYDEKKLC